MAKKLINLYGETPYTNISEEEPNAINNLWDKEQKRIDVLIDRFKNAFGQYWKHVENSVDFEGWVYVNEVPPLLDAYFEHNTSQEIDFQKSYEGEYKGSRWRPKVLAP